MGKRDRTTSTSTSTTSIPQKPIPQNSKDITLEDGKAYTAVTEGLATVLFPKTATKKDRAGNEVEVQGEVFYNPIQQFNRDLSVLTIKAFGDIFLEEKRVKKEEKTRNRAKGKGKASSGEVKIQTAIETEVGESTMPPSDIPREVKIETTGVGESTASPSDISSGGVKIKATEVGESIISPSEIPPGEVKISATEVGESTISPPGNEASNKETTLPDPMDITLTSQTPDPHIRRPSPPKFTILDALSATGLRALRYALEIPSATSITANDLDPSAVASISHNITYNTTAPPPHPTPLPPTSAIPKITVSLSNATHHMYSRLYTPTPTLSPHLQTVIGKYEVIDLDPFGTASPFLDAAVQAISDGGLLAVTCTDAGVWASTGYPEKCFSLYGGAPVKGEWSHEAGLRLILNSIAMCAARYGAWMEPLLSLSIDFYARVFVRIHRGPERVKRLASESMVVYNCDEGCGSWFLQRLGRCKEERNKKGDGTFYKFGLARAPTTGANCGECGFPMHLAGPMYAGPLHSVPFLTALIGTLPAADPQVYGTLPRISGMLQTALQESTPALSNTPFFFVTTRLAKAIHCESPPLAAFRGALKGLGYEVARSHCKPTSIKTDAPWSVVWEVMRRWVQKKPVKEGAVGPKQAGYKILRLGGEELTPEEKALAELQVVFDEKLGMDEDKKSGVVRYQINPTANWGPMAKGKKEVVAAEEPEVGVGVKRGSVELQWEEEEDGEDGGEPAVKRQK